MSARNKRSPCIAALMLSGALAVSLVALPGALWAQTANTVIHACYIPKSGTIYRTETPDLKENCNSNRHVPFEFNSQGPQGIQGQTGPQGLKGDAGTNGAAGAQGLKGDAGTNGAAGAQGLKGDAGTNGAAGAQGLKGDAGTSGAAGAQGLKGDAGTNGAAGAQGLKGDAGLNGAPGASGLNGLDGKIGPAGPAGPSGVLDVYTTGGDSFYLPAAMTTRTVIRSPACNGTDKAVSGAWWTDNGAANFSISNPGVENPSGGGSKFALGVMNIGLATTVYVHAVCIKTN